MADLDELRELRARLLFQETLDLDDYNDRETIIELIDNELAELKAEIMNALGDLYL